MKTKNLLLRCCSSGCVDGEQQLASSEGGRGLWGANWGQPAQTVGCHQHPVGRVNTLVTQAAPLQLHLEKARAAHSPC